MAKKKIETTTYKTKKVKLTPSEKAMITALYTKLEGTTLPKSEKGLAKAKKKGNVKVITEPGAIGTSGKGGSALFKSVIQPAVKKSRSATTAQQKEERRRSAARYLRRK